MNPNDPSMPMKTNYLGIIEHKARDITGTPFFLSRLDKAKKPQKHGLRLNSKGYDRDDPQDALRQYEQAHPSAFTEKAWNAFADLCFNFVTLGLPKALSLSAGQQKQRIDQKVLLSIARAAVDKFPELTIRLKKDAFDGMHKEDQVSWRKKMSIIRAAQHDFIIREFSRAYPGHAFPNPPTILYTGGRATGLLRILYCSIDEYVALYWSDWGLMSTDSGSYKAHVYDYIIEGLNVNWNAQYLDFNRENYEITEPGEYTFLGKGDRKIWSFEGPCAMIDHGIGDIPSMMKYALISNFTSTLNIKQVKRLIGYEAKAVAFEYVQRFRELRGEALSLKKTTNQVSAKALVDARQYFSKIMAQV